MKTAIDTVALTIFVANFNVASQRTGVGNFNGIGEKMLIDRFGKLGRGEIVNNI